MASDTGWYYIDPTTGCPTGPFDVIALQGLLSSGHIQTETSVWCEGQPEWQPLKDVYELKSFVHIALDTLKKAKQASKTDEDELAAFQAEVAAIEAEAETAQARPSTPEELEFEDDDGTTYVWDSKLRKYMPKGADVPSTGGVYNEADMVFEADQDAIPSLEAAREQQLAEIMHLHAEAGPIPGGGAAVALHPAGVKRGADDTLAQAGVNTATAEGASAAEGAAAKKVKKGAKGQVQQPVGWFELKKNTSIYMQGLPTDVTVEEVAEACSKFGLIKEDENHKPRIKLYRHKESGDLKGDALVTFLKEPSVILAINLLDGAKLRPGDPRCPVMSVQPAKFEQKGEAYVAKSKKPMDKKAKKAMLEKQERLLHWGGFDDKIAPEKVTVILKHMFRPQELASELGGATELEAEVLEEAKTLGRVNKVRVYKDHPDGVVSIRFEQEKHAADCIARMDGRFFSGQRISATMWDGVTNYAAVKVTETAEEEEARLEAYARELETKRAAAAQTSQPQQS